ncbi:MAG: Gfo/Idh/MocA family oxidoreductase, partial [Lentisphaeria bacterium]|nr:Gfo/Idh/MocA family oxidoreductase [Lentisphaeria bacterium]
AAQSIGAEIRVVATADVFEDRAKGAGKQFGVPPERCFWGFDAYRKALDTDADVVVTAASPNFRPVHLEASVEAGKHVFMEKPVAVDPPGVRRVIAAGEKAKAKGLSIVAGTQRRHQHGYLVNQYLVSQGAIGTILSGNISWCGGALWYRTRQPGESDAHYMVRNWVSFTEMSGDHIVEQHVHNIDVANWYLGRPPVSALGFGGRARRKTGNQFDFFSVDLDYGDDAHIHSMCRQVNKCYGGVREFFVGTEGSMWGSGKVNSRNEKKIEVPEYKVHGNPYVEEHVALLRSVIDGKPLNEAQAVAEATMAAIMGRISAYTGQLVRWSDVMGKEDSPFYNLTLKPTADEFEQGEVTAPPDDVVAVPGAD